VWNPFITFVLQNYPSNKNISIEYLLTEFLKESSFTVETMEEIGMEANIANGVQFGINKQNYVL
jgi:hypothetical protein